MAGALILWITGHYEAVRKGDAAVVGVTKLKGVTMEELKRPRRKDIPPALLAAAAKSGSVPRTPEFEAASKPSTPPSDP